MAIKKLAGGTNHVYLLNIDKRQYVLKYPKFAAQDLINRHNEYIAGQITTAARINIPFLYYDPTSGINITRYQQGSQILTAELLRLNSIWQGVADLLKQLHHLPQAFPQDIAIFELLNFYRKKLNPTAIEEILIDFSHWDFWITACHNALNSLSITHTPCHNDPILGNFLLTPHKIYLIDWEYAGNNDPCWDLASLSLEAEFDQRQDKLFLEYYWQNDLSDEIHYRFNIYKILVDYLWALWCCHMQDYHHAVRRWRRFKEQAKIFVFK